MLLFVVSCVETPNDDDFFQSLGQLSVSPGQVAVTARNQATKIQVNSNYTWRASSDVDWITLDKYEGSGSTQITVSIMRNTNDKPRTGYISFYETSRGLLLSKFKVEQEEKSKTEGSENGHDWIDIGLSVKWATMNVGAGSPEDYGAHYAWGETSEKNDYSLNTYQWYKSNLWMKYCINAIEGMRDNKTTLEPADDAAAANWGGSWRMPTKAEQDELLNRCSWAWITKNSVGGYEVTGPNGNSVFLPAAGFSLNSNGPSLRGNRGYYWSSTLNSSGSSGAYYLYFFGGNNWSIQNQGRHYGLSVRAVCP